jgi:hypothetical protein
MTAGNYRWVCTDRRSEAEVLNEIAAAHTPGVILHRSPGAVQSDFRSDLPSMKRMSASKYGLVLVTSETRFLPFKLWPKALLFLVRSPDAWIIIVDFGPQEERSAAARTANGIGDWLLLRHLSGTPIEIVAMSSAIPNQFEGELNDFGSKIKLMSEAQHGELIRHPLVPTANRLSQVRRDVIDNLNGMEIPAKSPDAIALKAGLFLWHDALDQSHECAQSVEGQGWKRAGDYWHAILHRREPDYGNSKYWLRRVGPHPIFADLGRQAEPILAASAPEWKERLLQNGWDPLAFVDFCQTISAGRHPEWEAAAEEIQELEMFLLLDSTYQDAQLSFGPGPRDTGVA